MEKNRKDMNVYECYHEVADVTHRGSDTQDYTVYLPCVKLSASETRAGARGRGRGRPSCSLEEVIHPHQTPSRMAG